MAGSLNHLIDDETGAFRFDLIENMHDAFQACYSCFNVISLLSKGDLELLRTACNMSSTALPDRLPVFRTERKEP